MTPFFTLSPTQPLALALAACAAQTPVAVAYSGGADSTALLLAATQRWPGRVQAIHVHHGLQAAADDFVAVCRLLCTRLGVPLHVVCVDAHPARGESPEAAARQARYAALVAQAKQHSLATVLLGQHADDQLETMLLALSRGAGLPGLSAMGPRFVRGGVSFERPLLGLASAELRTWLVEQSVPFVDDPSNTDERYTRNRIRHRLLPALKEAFPQALSTWARSAQHAAQAESLLTEVAEQDLAVVGLPPLVKALQALSVARQANVLRFWLAQEQARPSTAQLHALQKQIAACTTRGHQLHLKIAAGHVTLRNGALVYTA